MKKRTVWNILIYLGDHAPDAATTNRFNCRDGDMDDLVHGFGEVVTLIFIKCLIGLCGHGNDWLTMPVF